VNDLERDLRELFETRARNAAAPSTPAPGVLERARRRQFGTAFAAILGSLAILSGSIVGVRALVTSEEQRQGVVAPALSTAPDGFRPVVLPYLSIAYPEDWFLVALEPVPSGDRVLQLTNFDAGAARVDCEQGASLPAGGVLLEVQLGAGQEPLPRWPASLGVVPGDGGPCGADGVRGASWTAGGTAFSATALLAPDAAQDEVDLMERAFESLAFPEDAPQTEQLLGTSNLVLDSADSPVGPVALYAFEDGSERASVWIGIAGPAGSHLSGAGQVSRDPPLFDENVTMNLDSWGGVVWGDVSNNVVRAELRTVEGATFPATLIELPDSLLGGHAVWGIVDRHTSDRVTTLLYDAQGNVLNDFFPTGPRVTIATGTDPEGGPWELSLESTNEGTGLSFSFTNSGGGGGCCLRPLRSDFQLDGWSSGSNEPNTITALASDVVTRVAFEALDGTTVEGSLYPVPDASLEIPQVALVIVPSDVLLEGDVVGYDASGRELGREFVGDTPEPSGATPEIDAVWQSLYRARDATTRYFDRHATFAELMPYALLEFAHGPFTTTSRPEPEAVSVYVTDDLHVVVSSTAITGEAFCIAVEAPSTPNSSFNFRYGPVFAEAYEDCRGGWVAE
jgi:hypothetical protein